MTIPISNDVYKKYNIENALMSGTFDSSKKEGEIKFKLEPTMEAQGIKAIRVQDIMVHEIVRANKWQRPVIFAVTCSPDSKIGLDDYLWYQGLGWELKPQKNNGEDEGIDTGVLEKQLMSEVTPSTNQQYGYQYRNLNDPNVFYDENQKRMIQNYRTAFLRLALYYSQSSQNDKANASLARMEKLFPRNVVPMDWRLYPELRSFYRRLNNSAMADIYTNDLEKECLRQIENNQIEDFSGYYSPYRQLLDIYNEKNEIQK